MYCRRSRRTEKYDHNRREIGVDMEHQIGELQRQLAERNALVKQLANLLAQVNIRELQRQIAARDRLTKDARYLTVFTGQGDLL